MQTKELFNRPCEFLNVEGKRVNGKLKTARFGIATVENCYIQDTFTPYNGQFVFYPKLKEVQIF